MKIPTSSPVMVTGSTGYVGGVLVQQLLDAGLTVHCPVRDPSNPDKIKHLQNLPGGSDRLFFFKADLLDSGSYTESMKECSVVFHVASPFLMECPKGKEEEMLINPAVNGTLNVLESAKETDSVKRVVLTSSIVAIATDAQDCVDARVATGKMIDEKSWNSSASKDYNPYAFSKTLAERAAWKFVEDNSDTCGFDLVACNPSFVMGPGIAVHRSAESFKFIQMLGSSPGCPDMGLCFVDVRDVARGHVAAGFLPSEIVAGQRYILNGANNKMMGAAKILSEEFPNHPFPTKNVPKWLFWCVAPFLGLQRKYVSRSVGLVMEMDNSKSLKDLQENLPEYTPLSKTLHEMFQQCIQDGFVPSHGYNKPEAIVG